MITMISLARDSFLPNTNLALKEQTERAHFVFTKSQNWGLLLF